MMFIAGEQKTSSAIVMSMGTKVGVDVSSTESILYELGTLVIDHRLDEG
jgi:hypothetical protein